MKTNFKIFVISLSIILILSSCITRKKLTYLQYSNIDDYSSMKVQDLKVSVTPSIYKIMSQDILYIRVITPDPQWSALFNTTQTGQGGSMTEESATLVGYPVDHDGEIEIPFVGKIKVSGKTLSEVKTRLDSVFKKYVNDAAITVRLVNNYITIIGEVGAAGRYPINRDFVNVFEALSAAGDIDVYGNRQKVQLIRPSPYGPIVKEFSLKDRSILTSDFYYVMPNDIIYVPPMRGIGFSTNASIFTFFMSALTTALVLLGYFKAFTP